MYQKTKEKKKKKWAYSLEDVSLQNGEQVPMERAARVADGGLRGGELRDRLPRGKIRCSQPRGARSGRSCSPREWETEHLNLHAVALLEEERRRRLKIHNAHRWSQQLHHNYQPLLRSHRGRRATLSASRFSEVTLKRPLCWTTGAFDFSSPSSTPDAASNEDKLQVPPWIIADNPEQARGKTNHATCELGPSGRRLRVLERLMGRAIAFPLARTRAWLAGPEESGGAANERFRSSTVSRDYSWTKNQVFIYK